MTLGGAAPGTAWAAPADSSERIVNLTDGAIYRGEILEYVPHSHVTLRLVSGEIRRFEWSKVRRVSVVASASSTWPVPKSEVRPSALPPPPQVVPPEPPPPSAVPPAVEPPPPPYIPPASRSFDEAAYQDHLQRGDEAFQSRRYREALEQYRLAYDASGVARVHSLLAKTHRKLGNFADAYSEYREYLASDDSLDPSRREQLQTRMADMQRRQEAFAALPAEHSARAQELAFVAVRSPVPNVRLQALVDRQDLENSFWFSSAEKWRTVCKDECNAPVYRRATLRLVGSEVKPAPMFTLPPQDRDVLIRVRPYSKSVRTGAIAMMTSGIVLSLIGAGLAGILASSSSTPAMAPTDETPKWVGVGLFLGGAGIALGSIPVFFAARASVTIE